ncbi:hypothetical protein GR160_08615 [Flavobacterium sp. Sd200]|uniref:hypothetical protein n=1 Tax=Flavobacterium sp. Sd200 TaxID=2692211 RepID=UPI001369E673|nr:hypothetical protein [Flavobacterium sp. Sd200]MXN91290.1 hypothetical protein [Flavobacterium sp. Sd200]
MIHQLKTITPFIDFGFGITQLNTTANTPFTVWLQTLYNQNAYTFTLMATNGQVTQISNYEYIVVYPEPGTYQINITVDSANKRISLDSNILTVIVT